MHLFGRNRDHDYYFELLREEEQDTQSISRCSTAHHRDFRVVPRANRIFVVVQNPILCATSSTDAPPVVAPSRPWRSSVLAVAPGAREAEQANVKAERGLNVGHV